MGYDNIKDYRTTRKLIGLSPQELNFDVFFPIYKVLEFQAGYYGLSKSKAKERTELLLNQFGLIEKRNSTCRELSGGMKRRLQIAKSLIHDPPILILDEPTAGVDIELRYLLWDFLKKINQEGKTILLTTHYIEEAEHLCDRIAIINQGKIITDEETNILTEKLGASKILIEYEHNKNTIDIKGFQSYIEGKYLVIKTPFPNKDLPKIMQELYQQNISVKNIEINKSSLEQVFIKLTQNETSNK